MSELKAKMIMLEHKSIITENNDLYLEGVKEYYGKAKEWAKKAWESFKKFVAKIWNYFKSFFSKAETYMNDKKNQENYKKGKTSKTEKKVTWIDTGKLALTIPKMDLPSNDAAIKKSIEDMKSAIQNTKYDFETKEVAVKDLPEASAMISEFRRIEGIRKELDKNIKEIEKAAKVLIDGQKGEDDTAKEMEKLTKEWTTVSMNLFKKQAKYVLKGSSMIFKAFRSTVYVGMGGKSESSVFDTI
jgi:anti-sigma28 factor (negative regulator of flagellin synthesis)